MRDCYLSQFFHENLIEMQYQIFWIMKQTNEHYVHNKSLFYYELFSHQVLIQIHEYLQPNVNVVLLFRSNF